MYVLTFFASFSRLLFILLVAIIMEKLGLLDENSNSNEDIIFSLLRVITNPSLSDQNKAQCIREKFICFIADQYIIKKSGTFLIFFSLVVLMFINYRSF